MISRASTATLEDCSIGDLTDQEAIHLRPSIEPYILRGNELLETRGDVSQSKRLIISVDFGTTYSAVSYVTLSPGEVAEEVSLKRIESIDRYPGASHRATGDRMVNEVPTEVIYPLDRNFRRNHELEIVEYDDARPTSETPEAPGQMQNIAEDIEMAGTEADAADGSSESDLGLEFELGLDGRFHWGYQVHEVLDLPQAHTGNATRALSRFKLLLDTSEVTDEVRKHLSPTLEELMKKKIIMNPLSPIADYLTCLLRHTEAKLRSKGVDESYDIEIVLCVPPIWSQRACRDMQAAMSSAVQTSGFLGIGIESDDMETPNTSIENLFIVSEPEAAAAYVLMDNPGIKPHDTFVLLDAGGGTVDANTYTVSQTTPLRLKQELVEPDGALCGSSYLNEAFSRLLLEKLQGETYLTRDGKTLESIAEAATFNDFEYKHKRNFDIYETARNSRRIGTIPGLKPNAKKRFLRDYPVFKFDEIKRIFVNCLDKIGVLLKSQLQAAMAKGIKPDKVVLIGGFAESVSLQKYLERFLRQFSSDNHCRVDLIVPPNGTPTAVASGAVLRALNKRMGPRRIARSSYGILRTEPYQRKEDGTLETPEHKEAKPWTDPLDGLKYIKSTVEWVLKLGDEVDPVWECEPLFCSHTFRVWPPVRLLCEEVLYVSDTSTESHYQLKHPKNAGAQKIGRIVVDFSFLRDEGCIHPIDPPTVNGRRQGRRHYKVNFHLKIQVVDRDLRCFAIYEGDIVKRCQINIASGFTPGVK
ncbi:hypothetical protein F4677DRAFT_461746 [Hypoxylon crocopeplum]|nr:hypothetical protein F4677DRAFT_461746 [Hypoxylon crocopeplum]